MTYKIGVLRHDRNGHAEEQIMLTGKQKGLDMVLIDPFMITIGVQPDSIRDHGLALNCDGIISRCEITSGLAPEAEAYLRLLQFYENRNIPVINSSQSIIKCQDKFRTHYHLSECGIPTPKTFVTYEPESAARLFDEGALRFPVIVKKIYGSRGDGVYKISDFSEFEAVYKDHFVPGEVLFLQEFLNLEVNGDGDVRDFRVWVVRDQATGRARSLGAVYRNARGGNFRTNAAHGGYVSPVTELGKDIAELGEQALEAVSADVAGVDIARTKDGRIYVEEINISFDTGSRSQMYIGRIWANVLDLLVSRIELGKSAPQNSLSAHT